MDLLQVENISFAYPDMPDNLVLSDISFSLSKGEIVALVGSSGVGKTTLLNLLSGFQKPNTGRIFLKGVEEEKLLGKISYMLQSDMLLPNLKVIDNVALPYLLKKMPRKKAREKVLPYFEEFNLQGYENYFPNSLSGGMRQRCALMRTFFQDNEVLLLDEPFSALDELTRSQINEWFLSISRKFELSSVIITHSLDEALLLADKVYVLKGKPASIALSLTIDRGDLSNRDFTLDPKFLEYKRKIKDTLNS